jgi:chromosome partitioning protein
MQIRNLCTLNVQSKNQTSIINMKKQPQVTTSRLSLSDLVTLGNKAKDIVSGVRENLLEPDYVKPAPTFTAQQLGWFCDLDDKEVLARIRKGDLPGSKEPEPGKKRRMFSLESLRVWAQAILGENLRPEGADAIVIGVCNFKGGVSKTTTAVALAQGLSLRGHRVLIIDQDPQASATTLMGIEGVEDEETLLPLCIGSEHSASYAIRKTYWDGIDIIPASLSLYGAEFALPGRQKSEANFEFWNVLSYALDDVRQNYDVIVIDTSPALSYLTINAMLAADGLVIPVPPNNLDFISSSQFFSLFNDVAGNLVTARGKAKEYDFVSILLSRVDYNSASSTAVREWISGAYGDKLLPVEIPETSATKSASATFGTVYDIAPSDINTKTYRRAFDAYERFTELIESQILMAWQRQLNDFKRVSQKVLHK